MDDETVPTLLPIGALLLGIALWLGARVSRIRDAARYDRERLATEAHRLSQSARGRR